MAIVVVSRRARVRSRRTADAIALVVTLALASAACSGGGQKAQAPTTTAKPARSTTTSTLPPIEVDVRLGTTAIRGVGVTHGDPPPIDAAIADAVLKSVEQYVDQALLAPLGGVEANWDGLVGMGAAARLAVAEHDRGVLTTEGLPEVETAEATLASVDLVGLTEGFGSLPLVTARIDFTAELVTSQGPLSIHHFGELVLSDAQGWKIVGYDITVVRDDHRSPATTTSAAVTP